MSNWERYQRSNLLNMLMQFGTQRERSNDLLKDGICSMLAINLNTIGSRNVAEGSYAKCCKCEPYKPA
jgi:hypothetical protein